MALRKAPAKLDRDALLQYALKTLSGRAHSTGELRQKLERRAQQPEDIDHVVGQLKDYGYLNDRKFAEGFARSHLENRGFGRMRVLRDLRERRVAPKLAEQVATQTFAGKDEGELIEDFLRRKYRGVTLPEYLSNPKQLAAVYRRLRRAGFGSGACVRVLFRYAKEAESLEGLEDGTESGEQA